jgi:hypothetical protein
MIYWSFSIRHACCSISSLLNRIVLMSYCKIAMSCRSILLYEYVFWETLFRCWFFWWQRFSHWYLSSCQLLPETDHVMLLSPLIRFLLRIEKVPVSVHRCNLFNSWTWFACRRFVFSSPWEQTSQIWQWVFEQDLHLYRTFRLPLLRIWSAWGVVSESRWSDQLWWHFQYRHSFSRFWFRLHRNGFTLFET